LVVRAVSFFSDPGPSINTTDRTKIVGLGYKF